MKNCIRYIIFILSFLIAFEVYSQTNLREIGRIVENPLSKPGKALSKPETVQTNALRTKDDTVYSFNTIKRHGWFEPHGLLTKKQTKHRDYSLMFTGKNDKGHWTKMECINAYGRYVASKFSPYIARTDNVMDSLINDEWIAKIKGACFYEFISDPSGENIIQERAFDKDHKLVYAYSRVPIGSNQFIGSYKDFFGLPAEMRNNPGFKYGTLVLITEDEHGFEKRVEYIDAQRRNKPNSNGVFADTYEYDEFGNVILNCSIDSLGNNIKDNWGNCGTVYTHDTNHLQTSAMYTDEDLKPMRIDSPKAGDSNGTIKSIYKYDDYFRMTQQEFLTEKNEKDTNACGCHKMVIEYDSCGNQISCTGYDLNNNLSAMDASGSAQILCRYDSLGNILEIRYLDKLSHPVSTDGYLCKIEYKYDNGTKISEKRWCYESGEYKLAYLSDIHEYPGYKEEKTIWDDGTSRIVRYDKKNRDILTAFHDKNNIPALNYEKTWSYKTTEYEDIDETTTKYITSYYGPDGNLSQSPDLEFNKKITIRDLETKQEYYKDYINDRLINTFSKKFNDDDFAIPVEQADNNIFGNITRSGGVSNVRYYNAKVKWTPFSNISYIVGEDEFGEPDYLSMANGSVYYYSRNSALGNTYMSAENDVIKSSDYSELRDKLPKVMSLEVTDSIGYKLGLKDNDVVLIYGNYSVNLNEIPSFYDFRTNWTLASVLEANKNSRMVVFRVEDAKNNKYGLVEIDNLKGTLSDMGILAHIRYLTDKQKNRILSSIESNMTGPNPVVTSQDFTGKRISEGDNYVILAYTDMYRVYRDKPYAKYITDPAILLGTDIKDRNFYLTFDKTENGDDFESMLNTRKSYEFRYPIQNFYLTTDMRTVKTLCLKDQAAYTNWFDTKISDEDFNELLKLRKSVYEKIDSVKSKSASFKPKDLIATWQTADNDSISDYGKSTGYLKLLKDGSYEGQFINYGSIVYSEGNAIFKIERDNSGYWAIGDSLICLSPSIKDDVKLTCVDLLGADETLKRRAMDYLNAKCEKSKDYLLDNIHHIGFQWNNDLFINSLNKDSLVIDNGTEHPVIFTNVKNKKKKSLIKKESAVVSVKKIKNEYTSQLNPKLIGHWESEISNDTIGAHVTLVLNEDQSMSMNMNFAIEQELSETCVATLLVDLGIGGNWHYSDDKLIFSTDPALMAVYTDAIISGVPDDVAAAMRTSLLDEVNPQKENLAMELLKSNPLDGEMPVSEISESSFMMNGNKWERIKE